MRRRETTLKEYVATKLSGEKKKFEVLKEVYEEIVGGHIRIVDPNPPRFFYQYLVRLDYSAWLWALYVFTALTILSIMLTSVFHPIIYLRYVLGSIYVLFLPGYVTVEALYPRGEELSPLERLALSIGLSLAIVPLIGLTLNYTPWGIRLDPILYSISIYLIALSLVAAYRKYKIYSRKTVREKTAVIGKR